MELKFCKRCSLDGRSEFILDGDGVCNFCHDAQRELALAEKEKPNLPKIIERIKKDGENRTYDVLVGLSGGVDSSMVLHHAVRLGLRPLCFNVDNGYNRGGESDENVLKLVETLKVPFYRYVLDAKQFNRLYGAFMKAGIKNLEAVTDHILFAVTYEMANRYGIKWILTGGNVATESIMPPAFGEDARDLRWIEAVYKKVTGKRLEGLPTISLFKEQYYRLIKQKKFLRLLDYLDYNRSEAIELLKKEYNYSPYGEKHCESTLTWWFQNFYLFTKWGIDKRTAHYASLINSGQMTRKEAFDLLADNPEYPRLGIEARVMSYPRAKYEDFPNSKWIRQKVARLYRFIPRSWKS